MLNNKEGNNCSCKTFTQSKTINTHVKERDNKSTFIEELKVGLNGATKDKKDILQRRNTFSFKDTNKNNNSLTYGERLYFKQLALNEINKKNEKLKEISDNKNTKKNSKFMPEINSNNKAKSKYSQISTEPSKKKGFTTDELKEMNDLIEIQNYKQKKNIIMTNEQIDNLSEKLHNELKVKEINREKLEKKTMDEICPFTPKINEKLENPTAKDFFFRLQNWIDNLNYKIEENKKHPPVDDKTGQVLFKPCIYSSSGPKREDTFDYLWKQGGTLKNKREKDINDYYQRCKDLSNTVKISNKSEKLIDSKRNEGINNLFDIFDINNDGIIKYSPKLEKKISENFSEDFVFFFKNIINSLEKKNLKLDKEEFIDLISNLQITMTEGVRKEIFDCKKKVTK